MNYLFRIYILYCVVFNVNSQNATHTCDLDLTDLKYKSIDKKSFCRNNPCIVKCCGENEVIHSYKKKQTCRNIDDLKKILNSNMSDVPFLDYSGLKIYKNDIYKRRTESEKKFFDFTLMYSNIYMNSDLKCSITIRKPTLLEKGTLVQFVPNHYEYWMPVTTPAFCVDMIVGTVKNVIRYDYSYKLKINNVQALETKNLYTAIAMTISAFFLLLVLVVYSLLHQLRNIQGMLLCAYAATLMCMYTLKAGYLFYSYAESKSTKEVSSDCTVISELTYFIILASFFWLKLMSFDIWWTFRGTRKLRKIHRRGINVKFMIYASYAFGVPAVMTALAAILDNQDLPPHIVKPFFNKCLLSDTVFVYLYVPVIILTGLNCLLFLMTIYNIWLISRNIASFDKNTVKNNKNNQNRFWLYIKLWSIMGVSWILEIIQIRLPDDDIPVWLYILLNAYNVFIGVIIFFLFVFKTNIFLMLCKRFNIENRWTRRDGASASTRSELSKSSKSYSRGYSQTKSMSDSDVEDVYKKNEDGTKLARLNSELMNPT